MNKFEIDREEKYIKFNWHLREAGFENMIDWCEQRPGYDVYYTGIEYHTEQDLTAFLLRWS